MWVKVKIKEYREKNRDEINKKQRERRVKKLDSSL